MLLIISVWSHFYLFPQYQAEFRRFPIEVEKENFEDFFYRLQTLHHLGTLDFVITYTDPVHSDLLPINNDENFAKAKQSCSSGLMRIYIHRKGTPVFSFW